MEIFWLLYGWLLVVSILNRRNTQRQRLTQTILSGFGLWLVLALRSPYCGVDLASYIDTFGQVADRSFFDILFTKNEGLETGWLIYSKIIRLFTHDSQMLLAVTAAITVWSVSWMIYKYASNITLAFIIYASFGLYYFSFSGIRQALALAVTFYAAHFILENRKLLVFGALVLLASAIHSSAIVFFVALIPLRFRMTRRRGALVLIATLCVLPFLRSLIQYITPILFENRYQYYEDEGGAIGLLSIYAILFVSSLLISDDKDRRYNIYRWMLLFALCGQSLGLISTGAMTRIAFYFSIFYPLYIPEFLGRLRLKPEIKLFIKAGLIIGFITFFYLTNKGGYLDVVPYHFFWETGQSI